LHQELIVILFIIRTYCYSVSSRTHCFYC